MKFKQIKSHNLSKISHTKTKGDGMTFSIILLGVLFILVLFNVGESIYKKLNFKKSTLLILLLVTMVCYFIPGIKIASLTFTLSGFFLPLVLSIIVLFKVKNLKAYFKIFVTILISFSLNIVYNLITFDVYESAILQPYLILGLILGTFPLFLTKTPTRLFSANFIGITLSEIVFYLSRYSVYGNYYMTIGSEKVFATLLTSFTISLLSYYFARKVKAMHIKHKLTKAEKERTI